jgi:hypothetical protein
MMILEPKLKDAFIVLMVLLSFTVGTAFANDNILRDAYSAQKSDLQVQGSGKVIRLLSDDNTGSRHQRFLIRLASGQTLLVAHNIDLAEKILSLRVNDFIEFYGEYEWNSKGGVIHWTHRDPNQRHTPGWIKHNGVIYQ